MSLLIVGNNTDWAIEKFYCNHLNKLGLKTSIFDVNKYYNLNSIFFKLRFKIMDLSLFKSLNRDLIKFCCESKPKFVWVFKGIEIYPETLIKLKSHGFILINYNPDHPFIRYSPSHGGKNIPDSIPLYDLIFSYRKDLVYSIKQKYGIETCSLPFGYEKSKIDFNQFKKVPKVNRLCFIGTADKQRSKLINLIARNGHKIDVYSGTYPEKKLLKHKNINIFSDVYNQDFWNTLFSYDIQLNFLRKHNINSHNMRTFEVPGAGGLLLTGHSEEQLNFFTEKKEIFTFKNQEQLLNKIETLKSMSDSDKHNIRSNAKLRSIKSEYSYFDRSKIAYNFIINHD